MTIFTVIDESTREVLFSGSADEPHMLAGDGKSVIEGVAHESGAYLTIEGDRVPIPTKPSNSHEWDWTSKTWVPNIDGARLLRKVEIESERERRGYLTIQHAGSAFDADAKAQRNISAWQAQIAAGVSIPSGFVWRDANNVDHPADAAFVNALGEAITVRGTMLYQAAWTHKAAIAALSTVEDILAYDITTGWPS